MKKIGIIFPHQLFTQSAWFSEVDELYLSEEFLFFRQYEFHKQKIAFHRASMKSWESGMVDSEANIHYIDAQDERSDVRILIKRLAETYPNFELHTIDPTDNWLSKHISHACETNQVQHIQHGLANKLKLVILDFVILLILLLIKLLNKNSLLFFISSFLISILFALFLRDWISFFEKYFFKERSSPQA